MGKESDLSPKKVGQVVALLKLGKMSQYEISGVVGVSRSSVKNIKRRVDLGLPLCPQRKDACGRQRKTTPRADRKIRDICLQNRKLPVRLLTQHVQDAGIKISERTVRRRLLEQGLVARRPAKKPRLNETMIKKRLEWAKKYKKFTVHDWEKVIYSCVYDKKFKKIIDRFSTGLLLRRINVSNFN